MASARRVGKWVLIGLGGLAAVLVVLRVGAGLYLNSASGRALVGNRIGSMIGLPVEVADLDVGARTSSIKFRILDPALGTSPKAEVLAVESASTDVSFTDLVTGRANPTEVHLKGVSVALRMSADGKILTTLPTVPEGGGGGGSVPVITVESGRVAVQQEGRPEFVLTGLNLRAEPSGDKVVLKGSADDAGWGKWTLAGEVEKATKTGWVELVTDDAPLDLERLKSIPTIPLMVWENAQPAGRGKATARFAVGPNNEFKYDVNVTAKGATLGVPAAEVTLTDVNGLVRVHDGEVDVSGTDPKAPATGKLAGGSVAVGARWNYSQEPAVGDPLTVTVDRLAVKDLPAKWGLKNIGGLPTEGGFLTGGAKIKILAYEGGRVETFGGGKGKLDLPNFLGGAGAIDVTLGGDGQKLTFNIGGAAPPPPPAKEPGAALPPPNNPWRDTETIISRKAAEPPSSETVQSDKTLCDSAALRETPPARDTLRVTVTNERELFALVAFLAVQPKDEPQRVDQTNLDATITLRDIDIAQFIQQLQLKVPYKVAGKVTVQAKLGVQLGQAATASAYKLTGTLTSPEVRFEGLTVRDLSTEINYQGGKLALDHLRANFPQPDDPDAKPGTLSGSARADIDPAGDLVASLTLDRIPLGPVAGAVPDLGVTAGGQVTGKAEFKAPFEKIGDPTTWTASATVRSDALSVAGRNAKDVALTAAVDKGKVTLKQAAATIEGIPLTADGTLALTDKYAFAAVVKTTGTSITDLRKLVPEAALPVPVEGVLETETNATGTLSPLAFTATGRVSASKLTLNKTPANRLDLKWQLTEERVKLTDLNADLFGGHLSGSLDYPFDPSKSGAFALTFKEVDAAAAAAFVPDFPVKIAGAVTGKVAGAIPAANEGKGRVGNLDVDLTAPRLTVQGIPAERLVGKAAVKNGAIEYSLEGKTLGGSFDIKGRYPGAKKDGNVVPAGAQEKKGADAPKGDQGALRISDIDLSQLAGALKVESLRPLGGRLDVTFDYANDLSSGSGRVLLRGLAWGDEEASPEIVGLLLLRDGFLELRDLSGSLAGGLLRGRGRVQVDNPARNFVTLTLDRAEAARLLAPVPDLAGVVKGNISAVVRGTVGREVRGSGTVTVSRGSVGGADVSELRIPFTYATAVGGYSRLTVHELSTRAGSGRATGDLSVEWNGSMRVGGQVRFIDVPIKALAPGLGENALLGNGRITGRFDLAGSNVRTADDLTGTLIAQLNNTSVKEVPLLSQAVPYLNPLGVTKPFQSGDIRGTLARGVFRLQRLALANPSAQVFAEGSITLRNSRLDLAVVAHTGTIGPESRGLRLLGLRLPVFGPVPVSLIRDVSDFLSNRTVRLTITGTTGNPVVRVNTRALLTEEAVRFFVSRYVPGEVATVLGVGGAGLIGGTAASGSSGNGTMMPQR